MPRTRKTPLLLSFGLTGLLAFGAAPAAEATPRPEGAPPERRGRERGVPPGYRSGSLADEPLEFESRFDRVEEHVDRQEWAPALSLLDEILAEATSPQRGKKLRQRALLRRRAAEKARRKREAEEKRDQGGGGGAAGRGAGAGGGRPPEEVDDDELAPTIEVHTADGLHYLPIAAAARRRIEELPEEARELYRRTYEAPARQALQRARDLPFSAARPELVRIADRYPLTASGRIAREELAARLADAGQAGRAARAIDARLELGSEDDAEDPGDDRATLLARSALYHLLAGAPRQAARRLERIGRRHSESPITVRGQAVLGADLARHELFRSLAETARARGAAPSIWPTGIGPYDRARCRIEARELPPAGTEARWVFGARDGGKPSGSVYPGEQAVVHDGRLLVRSGSELVALDSRSGKIVWSTDPGYGASASAASAGARAITLCRSGPEGRVVAVVLDGPGKVGFSRSGRAESTPNRLFAYDVRTGKLAWRFGGDGRPAGRARGLVYTAPPLPAGGCLVAPATRDSGYYLVGIDASGARPALAWVVRLYSFNPGFYRRYGTRFLEGTLLAASEDTVWFAPGHGLAGAVSGATGELRWLARYRTRRQGAGTGGSWVGTAPIVVERETGDRLVVAPRDSAWITVFDAATGGREWEQRFETGTGQLLGADRDAVYVASREITALSLTSGETIWKSESKLAPAGRGFLAAGHLYVPGAGGAIRLLDASSGSEVASARIIDPRVDTRSAMNLLPVGPRLVGVGPGGVVSLRAPEESWSLVRPGENRDLYRRARLLRGAGKHAEAIELLYRLLGRYREGEVRKRLVGELVRAVDANVRESRDPAPIRRLLDARPPIVSGGEARLGWRLREAALELEKDPARSGARWLDLLREGGHTAPSPEGNEVEVSIYASDVLRQLRARADAAAARELPGWKEAAARARRLLKGPPSSRRWIGIVTRLAFTESEAEALALLARRALDGGDEAAARSALDLLVAEWPKLGASPEIAREIEALRAARSADLLPPPPLTFARAPESAPAREGPWGEEFRFPPEEGVAVESAEGSAPFPAVLAVHAGRLRAFDFEGRLVLERTLEEYPDIEDLLVSLPSHVEEPFVAHLRDGVLVLVAPAGCYAFGLPVKSAPGGKLDPAGVKPLWRRTWPHPLEHYRGRARMGWGRVAVQGHRNAFPRPWFTPGGDPVILQPDGELQRVDRRTGKLLWRLRPDGSTAVGELTRSDAAVLSCVPPRTWAPGSRLRLGASGSTAILEYRLPDPRGGSRGSVEVLATLDRSGRGGVLPGLARVLQGKKLTVLSEVDNRRLWSRSTSSRLVMVTPGGVWTSSRGNLKARALRSGRVERTVELPNRSTVVGVWDDPRIDGDRPTLITAGSASILVSAYLPVATRTGTELHLVRLTADHRIAWRRRLAAGPVAFDGSRRILPDGRWLLAFNEQEPDSEKWYTRVVAVEPEEGRAEMWFETAISGKGTGLPPRLAAAGEGLVVGNSEGFGWFARKRPETEATAAAKHSAPSGGPEDPREDSGKETNKESGAGDV